MRTPAPRLLAAAPAALLLLSLAACSDDGDHNVAADPASESPSESAEAPSESPSPVAGECTWTPDGSEVAGELPPTTPTVSGPVKATIKTSAGDLRVTLDGAKAPCTVTSFLSLAEQGYFDDTPCHRMTSYPDLSVLQCGDPTGQGTGGPGYTIPDELDPEGTYSAGTLAMANTGMPDSGGSQFFIVYADSDLPPSYTIFGTVDQAGIDAVAAVAADGTTPPQDGAPNTPVTFTGVVVK